MGLFGSLLDPLIGAVGSFLGGRESSDSAVHQANIQAASTEAINNQNIAFAREVNANNEALQREFAAKNEALQREFARMGVQWKVQDAVEAGLHPVYAIGAGGAAYSPATVVGGNAMPNLQVPPAAPGKRSGIGEALSAMGQGVSRALAAQMTSEERALKVAQLDLLSAQASKERAQAAYYESEASRARHDYSTAGYPSFAEFDPRPRGFEPPPAPPGGGSADVVKSSTGLVASGLIQPQPDKVTSGRPHAPSIGAGLHPGQREYLWGADSDGRAVRVILPHSEEGPAEAWSEMSWYDKLYWLQLNARHYGGNWLGRFLGALPKKPTRGGGSTGSW